MVRYSQKAVAEQSKGERVMDVILLERVEKLGQMGDVVSVKPGFARNFLLPQGKALRATDNNKALFETQRAQLEAENLKRKQDAEAVVEKMGDITVVLIRQAGDAGQLYGSVTARDIAEAVTEAGATIKRSQVVLAEPIKTIGMHDIKVTLHSEVNITVTANVARSADEAKTQEETGAAVLSLAQQEVAEAQAEVEAAAQAAAEAVAAQADEIFEDEAVADAVADAEAAVEAAVDAGISEPVPDPVEVVADAEADAEAEADEEADKPA
jgi:large subunit ribosomal protein L9